MASREDVEEVAKSMSNASLKVTDEKKIDRHCAFCLALVKGEEVKVCGGCRRRAYCSKKCQKADWKPTPIVPASNGTIYGYGQGHKNWCGLAYGEEDLDWKVAPISGKGLGLIAVRDLPYLYRIMVEGPQHPPEGVEGELPDASVRLMNLRRSLYKSSGQPVPPFHPEMSNLLPENSNISAKFMRNYVSLASGLGVGLRFSRINHSCKPNASFTDAAGHDFPSLVLLSHQEIKAGEEICRSYAEGKNFPFFFLPNVPKADLSYEIILNYTTAAGCRLTYKNQWGLDPCPPDCFCRGEKFEKLVEETKELGEYCKKNVVMKPALKKFQKILENAKEFGVGPIHMSFSYLFAARLAMTRKQTLEEAKKYLKMSLEIKEAGMHPKLFATVGRNYVPLDLSKYPEYLAAEGSSD